MTNETTEVKAPKPRLSLADVAAYQKIAALPVGTELQLGDKRATFTGMMGYLIALNVRGRNLYLRQGDPRIRELANG